MRKNVIVLLLILVLSGTFVLTAADFSTDHSGPEEERYAYIESIEVKIQKDSSGNAVCKCIVDPVSGYTVQVTMYLTHTTNSWTASGSSVNLARTCAVPGSGSYQTGAMVRVYNSSGVQVNSFTKYSPSLSF